MQGEGGGGGGVGLGEGNKGFLLEKKYLSAIYS